MPTGYWPKATARPIPNTASPHPGEPAWLHEVAGTFTQPPLGWVLHVVVGNGSPYETFHRAVSPQRRFSTLWVAKDGHAEQFAPLEYKSWAQGTGNGLYWSAETEGFPTEPLTDAQIHTLAAWHVYSGTPNHIATSPGERGIITHNAGGAAWGGHTCPDPAPNAGPRSHQRAAIIAAAAAIRGGNPLVVDGILGPDTIRRWQATLNALGAKPTLATDGQLGPNMWTAVQRWLGHTPVNGIPGRDTIRALERRLGMDVTDGILGRDTVRALQRWLNAQTAKGPTKSATLEDAPGRHVL